MQKSLQEQRAKRYCIYIRKSTDDPKKQVRSVEDQLTECLEFAKRNGIKVAEKDIIQDSLSARYSGRRPHFDQLIKMIRKGEVDGLIAWHPDRLARNMKEAGEIIDLLDAKLLVDLQFVAHAFINDYNGKMALGIAFVFAKQYSDKLGADVSRGLERSLQQGRSAGQYKPGYVRNDLTGLYEPDESDTGHGYNIYELVQESWEMRLNGESIDDISRFMNEHGYYRTLKSSNSKGRLKQPMSNQKLSNMFADKFYYGILTQGGNETNLLDIYDFAPMIDEGQWYIVQRLGSRVQKKAHVHNNPFHGLVYCEGCNSPMTDGISKGNGGRYLSFWCQNKKRLNCQSKGTIRAKVIIDAMMKVFEKLGNISKEDYQRYVEAHKIKQQEIRDSVSREVPALHRALKAQTRELDELIAGVLPREAKLDDTERRVYKEGREKLEKSIDKYKKRIKEIEETKIERPMDYESLLNLLKTLSASLKFAPAMIKDQILRNTVLNLSVINKKIVEIRLKEPFASAYNGRVIQDGGSGWD